MPQKPKFVLNKNNIDYKKIGRNIANVRKKRGLTQTELAELIGISQNLISHYEVGRLKISAEMIIHFALALNISSDKILGIKQLDEDYEPISPNLFRKMKEVENLPLTEKRALIKTIDMYINKDK